ARAKDQAGEHVAAELVSAEKELVVPGCILVADDLGLTIGCDERSEYRYYEVGCDEDHPHPCRERSALQQAPQRLQLSAPAGLQARICGRELRQRLGAPQGRARVVWLSSHRR